MKKEEALGKALDQVDNKNNLIDKSNLPDKNKDEAYKETDLVLKEAEQKINQASSLEELNEILKDLEIGLEEISLSKIESRALACILAL